MKKGYPDNPVAEDLFSDNYLLSKNVSLEEVKSKGYDLIELHFQSFPEIEKINEIQKYVSKVREMGFELVMHCPFLDVSDGIKLKLPVSVDGSLMAAKEEIINTIELCKKLNIKVLTMHASSALKSVSEDEFEKFMELLSNLNVKGIKLCIETGGLSISQLEKVILSGYYVNLDTAHLVLDLISWNVSDPNEVVWDFFVKHEDKIPILHLSQTDAGKDCHKSLDEEGVVNVNSKLLDYVKNKDVYVIFECKPN